MKCKGRIKELEHIVISDPSYDESVTCRYERNNLEKENWLIDMNINQTITPITKEYNAKGIEFTMLLYKSPQLCKLREDGAFYYLQGIKIEETDIGMDTACVAFGVNERADELTYCKDDWQPDCSLQTLTDGIFGTVKEGKINDDIAFIWVSGYLDEDTGYSIEDVINYLEYQLNITELTKDKENIEQEIENDKDM